ncbi:MAG: hypothetical protein GY790_10200 [Bacteroidetes bacterium]|nr:hypothetical protein [Bacteroidota bacterium]
MFNLVELPDEKKVEVRIDGELFTSYIYPDNIAKPVLYPLITTSGKVLTRGFPIDKIPGERVDHPHHVGHWMNYGDVNGLDFWNNSEARPAEDKHMYGTIFHKEVRNIQGRDDMGMLEVVNEWKTPDGVVLLEEQTRFIFSVQGNSRIIDRITTLNALNQEVSFKDNKEGMFAVRVTRAMELPSEKPAVYLDAHGVPTETKVLDNTGVNGNYLSSEGLEGEGVWGTRARWMKLHSTMEGEKVAIVIFDHPDNVGYPTYWHARGYGLFAANPLGQSVFSEGEYELDFKLAPNESVSFKFRLLVHSGKELSADTIHNMADEFARLQTPALH